MATTNPFDITANSTGTLTPAPNTVTPLTPNPGPTAAQYTPQLSTVDPAKETTAGQLQSIIAEDSPLMQQARAQAKQGMAQRGLINSSMSQGAGVAAMLDRATPIATADAATYANRSVLNQNATNTGGQFNAGEQNKFGLQTGEQSFTASQNLVNQNFSAAQAQLDRAQQTAVTDKSIKAQADLATAQQNFNAAQSALDRSQQTSIQKGQQTFESAEAALNRKQQEALQTGQQEFTASQNAIQNTFAARQAELERSGRTALQAQQIASSEAMAKLQEAGVTNRFDKEIALKSSQFNIEQNNIDKRQLIDNKAKFDAIGLQIEANRDTIPTTFAANIANTTMAGVDAIIADGTLSADAKKGAINNLVTYANSQIAWGAKFYGTTIPPISAP